VVALLSRIDPQDHLATMKLFILTQRSQFVDPTEVRNLSRPWASEERRKST
jgi:hypothetical protein